MPDATCFEAIPREGLSDDDRAFLRDWIETMGDGATRAAVRGRVTALLRLRDEHPARPPLSTLVEDPYVRALLLARPEGRPGISRRWHRALALRGESGAREPEE